MATLSENSQRKTRSYSLKEWVSYYDAIRKLYVEEGKSLDYVREFLWKKHGFFVTEDQFKKKINQWKLGRKVRKEEALWLLTKRAKRKAEEPPKETEFLVRGRPVSTDELRRLAKRRKGKCLSPLPSTPEDITYHSPERNASNEEVDDGEMVPIGMPQSDLYIQPEDHDQYQQRRTLFTVFYQDDQEWARELESFDWEGFREHLPDDMVKHRYEYLRGNSEPLIIDID